MNLQPQMAPCVCPPADKQIPFELWGCNSVWGRCKGRGGEAVGLFGGLWPPQQPLMEFQPHNSQLPLLDPIQGCLWCGSWAEFGAVPAPAGEFIWLPLLMQSRAALWASSSGFWLCWGTGEAQSKLGCCSCDWSRVCTSSSRVTHQRKSPEPWNGHRGDPEEISLLAFPKGLKLPCRWARPNSGPPVLTKDIRSGSIPHLWTCPVTLQRRTGPGGTSGSGFWHPQCSSSKGSSNSPGHHVQD